MICEAAAGQFKVLISGQGGDELFGGYPVYQAGWLASGMQRLPGFMLSLLNNTSQFLPYSVEGRRVQSLHRIKKLLLSLQGAWPEPFLKLRSAMGNVPSLSLLSPEVLAYQEKPFARHLEHFHKAEKWDVMHQMMYLDMKTYLTSPNLLYSDKTSMSHSVELRVPLLDKEIEDPVCRLPGRFKVNMRESKILLKAVAEKYLPHDLIYRKKSGFGLPLKDWFLKDLQPMAQELLSESRLRKQGLFDPAVPASWLKEHREMAADHSMKLYSLMTFQIWCDVFGI